MAEKPIRIMIIDESIFFRSYISRAVSADSLVDVVGVASSPGDAMQLIPDLNPNIVTLNIEANGLDFKDYIGRMRKIYPQVQIVIIGSLNSKVFEALKAGAVDFVAKPNIQLQTDNTAFIKSVLAKLKFVYSIHLGKNKPAASSVKPPDKASDTRPNKTTTPTKSTPLQHLPGINYTFPSADQRVIAIGASTGGTEAILSVVKSLPANTPGIVIVQHMPPVFTAMYADRLDKMCIMSASEAKNGDRVRPGHILLAPGDMHMRLARDSSGFYVQVKGGEKVSGHCPSVDVLFESVANTARKNAVGVILTGMGGDGAKNLLKMRQSGAFTIGQDEPSCVVYGMPMVAFTLGAVEQQLSLNDIPSAILNHMSKSSI